jgi:hypothetical protein
MIDSINNSVTAFWPVLGSVLFFVVWLVRLEAKVLSLENDKTSMNVKLDALQVTLTSIATSLARLEGRLEGGHIE